ncbi:MAG: hypothetical protein V3R95_03065 [Dehalococcoidia bacterium]
MDRLAIFGWDDDLPRLLSRLDRHASLTAIAVGAQGAAELLQARNATGLACYRHLLPMARSEQYDAVLIGGDELAGEIASAAAERGADLIARADRLDAESLSAVASAAVQHGVAMSVIRTAFPAPALGMLAALAAEDEQWRPRSLQLDWQADAPAASLLAAALAGITAVCPSQPSQVVVSGAAAGDDHELLAAHIRFSDGALATLNVRGGDGAPPAMRCSVSTPAGSFEFDATAQTSAVTVTPAEGEQRTEQLAHGDAEAIAAHHVAEVRAGGGSDALPAQREAAVLLASEQALASGRVQFVSPPVTRTALRLLEGGGQSAPTPRTARLQLVTV